MKPNKLNAEVNEIEIRFQKIILDQFARYPKMQVQDLYKLIHQSVMGSEHAIEDTETVKRRLEEEIANLPAGPEEPVVDPISIDGEIVRINLRPYIQAGGKQRALLRAFIQTANEHRGTMEELEKYWSYAENLVLGGNLNFSEGELTDFFESMRENAFPALHHSKMYEDNYRPAYRVIAMSILTG